jgi:hypothetical protein
MIRIPRRRRRGLTLIELMVGTAMGMFVVAAAFTFVVHQNQLLEFTSREIDRDRSGRLALDMLGHDLRHAGVGVGYEADGSFRGIMLGSFTVAGGATFGSDDHPITLKTTGAKTYPFFTDDVGMRLANGSHRSIVMFSDGVGEVCRGGEFEADDVVLFRSEDGVDARTARLLSIGAADACSAGTCVNGCDAFTWAADDSFFATPTSADAEYDGGTLAGGYQELVWFVHEGNLNRATINSARPCNARDVSCGGTVAGNVETLQMQVWQWDSTAGAWEDRTALHTIDDRRRLRIDIELVVRMDGTKEHLQQTIPLELEPGSCLPSCGARDYVPRRAMRPSVEVRNSGRLQLGGS